MDKLNNERQFERMIGNLDINSEPPPGHREELKGRMLMAFAQGGKGEPAGRSAWRARLKGTFLMRNTRARVVAAAGVLAIGLVALALWAVFQQGAKLAFADVRQQVLAARSVRFRMSGTVEMPNLPEKGSADFSAEITVTVLESGLMRQTMQTQGGTMVMVFDWSQRKMLTLVPAHKQAILTEMTDVPAEQAQTNLFEQFRNASDKAAVPVGEKEIGGRTLQGFRVQDESQSRVETTVWVDPETRLPVEMEITTGGGLLPKSTMVMSDFVWDVEVDESLMSLDVPEGYELSTMTMNMGPATEQDVVDSLKMMAELNDGQFPDTFDMAGLGKVIGGMDKRFANVNISSPEGKALKARMMEIMPKIGRGFMFAADPKNGSDWHYAGMNVKQGDAGVPIFWYLPKDSETYRLIDADLTVRDVAPEDLPDVPSIDLSNPPAAPTALPVEVPAVDGP